MMKLKTAQGTGQRLVRAAVALAVILPMAMANAAVVSGKTGRGARPPAPLPPTAVKNYTGVTPPPAAVTTPTCVANPISPC